MDGSSRVLAPVVIGQDEQTELHVQAVIQSGRRQLDIRIWRRGPAGFAPSRSALTLEADDLSVLIEGIDQLLEVSNGARQVARVVCNKDDSRRLRAETEPFGTHFTARLGFWQRVRDSWRPMGDGLQLGADQLIPLQKTLRTLRPHLTSLGDPDAGNGEMTLEEDAVQRWPSPGADWLTAEGDQLAFHPRGLRLTASIVEEDEKHQLVLQQWRRDGTLWVPCDVSFAISVPGLEALLALLRKVRDFRAEGAEETQELGTIDGSRLRVELIPANEVRIQERPAPDEDYEGRLHVPIEFVPHLGRLLVEAGNLLLARLSPLEREELLKRDDSAASEEIVSEALLSPDEAGQESEAAREARSRREAFTTAEELVARIIGEEQPSEPEEPEPPEEAGDEVRRLAPLGEVRLGRHSVYLYDLREDQQRYLSLQWEGRSLDVPLDTVENLVSDLREMYYQTLRGRRGQASAIGTAPSIRISVHHKGSSTQVLLEREMDGEISSILFPVAEVPAFLNAAETALLRSNRESV